MSAPEAHLCPRCKGSVPREYALCDNCAALYGTPDALDDPFDDDGRSLGSDGAIEGLPPAPSEALSRRLGRIEVPSVELELDEGGLMHARQSARAAHAEEEATAAALASVAPAVRKAIAAAQRFDPAEVAAPPDLRPAAPAPRARAPMGKLFVAIFLLGLLGIVVVGALFIVAPKLLIEHLPKDVAASIPGLVPKQLTLSGLSGAGASLVLIDSTPPGASVYLGSELVGVTPYAGDNPMAEGEKLDVRVELRGYAPYRGQVTGGGPAQLEVKLERLKKSGR